MKNTNLDKLNNIIFVRTIFQTSDFFIPSYSENGE